MGAVFLFFFVMWYGIASQFYNHTTDTQKPFVTDGCTAFCDGSWRMCCVAHDRAYWQGGTRAQRRDADNALRHCVYQKSGNRVLSDAMYGAVRIAGVPYIATPWRWGFGWTFGRGYKEMWCDKKVIFPFGILRQVQDTVNFRAWKKVCHAEFISASLCASTATLSGPWNKFRDTVKNTKKAKIKKRDAINRVSTFFVYTSHLSLFTNYWLPITNYYILIFDKIQYSVIIIVVIMIVFVEIYGAKSNGYYSGV